LPPVELELESEPELELELELEPLSGPASADGVHVPDWQVPSEHGALSGFAGFEQTPVVASQVPLSWQSSEAEQTTGVPAVHMPAWQVSVCVHASPSSQPVPVAFGRGVEHWPVALSQMPASWHWSDAAHVTGLAPVQVPAWQVSICVQALLSSHAVPFATGGATQAPVPTLQAAMGPHTGKRLSPLVCTGVLRLVVVVSPSWP
jgi:hypothetical protein